jgi:hypothetical protein
MDSRESVVFFLHLAILCYHHHHTHKAVSSYDLFYNYYVVDLSHSEIYKENVRARICDIKINIAGMVTYCNFKCNCE